MNPVHKAHYQTIWTAYANIWLGLWLLTSMTFGIGFVSGCNDLICGALLVVFGVYSISYRKPWAPWAACLVGVWLQLAPIVFWYKSPAAYLNDTMVGVFAIAFSLLIPDIPGRIPDTGNSVPPGWSYNPSSWPQRFPVIFFGILAWFASRYLAAFQLGYIDTVWDPFFGDGTLRVITSDISRDFPVSDAGLGAFAYTLDVLLAMQGDKRRWHTMPWMVMLFGVSVIPCSLVSIVLIILQPLVVGFWCSACLFTAVCMLFMVAFAVDEVAATWQFLQLRKKEGKSFWKVFWYGDVCPEATKDETTPLVDSSFKALYKAATWGVTLPWNLLCSVFLGVLVMFLPAFISGSSAVEKSDSVVGALIVVVAVIATAEVIRKVRYLNVILALWMLIFPFLWEPPFVSHLIEALIAISLIVLSFL